MQTSYKMKSILVKLDNLSGKEASIYGILVDDLQITSFETFLEENKIIFICELIDIISRLQSIGNVIGAREQFFKLDDGNKRGGVCALFDTPNKKLRLFYKRYGTSIVIVGGGGPKNVQKLKLVEKLNKEKHLLRKLSALITERFKEGEISFTKDYRDFLGNLEFNDEDYE